jgi:hypothetical protein
VVEESDGDLMGDGINIAARLEASFRKIDVRARNQKGHIEWLTIWSCAESDQQWTSIK